MALTAYIDTSLLATFIAEWWGLGWFARLTFPQGIAVMVILWCVVVVLSDRWLDRFQLGPLEWLWRWLEYGRVNPA